VDGIAQCYFADIHGSQAVDAIAERRVSHDVPDRLRFFSIYDDTEYASGDHMDLLTGFLGSSSTTPRSASQSPTAAIRR